MDYNKVQACMESDHGNELLFKAGAATDNLNPRLTYVPWVMINGMRNNTAEFEFFKTVQQAYMVILFKLCFLIQTNTLKMNLFTVFFNTKFYNV